MRSLNLRPSGRRGSRFHLSHAHNLRGRTELLVVAEGAGIFFIVALEQRQSYVDFGLIVLRQPDLIIDASLLIYKASALVNARQYPAERNRVDGLDIHLCELHLALVDPQPALELGKHLGFP